jgi:4-amino-4-deoxy-L-arabinose transferase-like glycosyltransferase
MDVRTSALATWGQLALLAASSVLVLTLNFNVRPLVTNDDARFPILARDVIAHGHWLLPRLPDGLPHQAKPPLAAWLITLASWPTGAVTARTALVPSLIEAVAVVLLTYAIGRRLFGTEVGMVAGLITMTTVGVFSFAHSAMPDMTLLVMLTAAIACYAESEGGRRPVLLLAFYALVGVACLAKGTAGLLPLPIVVAHALTVHGRAAWRRLWPQGLLVMLLIAVPWWIAAAGAGRERFVQEIVLKDQLYWYMPALGWHWRAVVAPVGHAIAVSLPWSLLVPPAIWAAVRGTDAAAGERLRLLLVWLAVGFAIVAVSYQQRERYYLPLCPAVALLVAWWYSTLTVRRKAWAFAAAWIAVVAVGAWVDTIQAHRASAVTDLAAIREALDDRVPVYATDVPELALSFHLERPVLVSESYDAFRRHAGPDAQLIISRRALASIGDPSCIRHVAAGSLAHRAVALISADDCPRPRSPVSQAVTGRGNALGRALGALA